FHPRTDLETAVTHVANHSDDGAFSAVHENRASDGIVPGEERPGGRLAQDHRQRSTGVVPSVEQPAALERNPAFLVIIERDRFDPDGRLARLVALDTQAVDSSAEAERNAAHRRGRADHARSVAHAIENLGEERRAVGRRLSWLVSRRDVRRDHALWFESRI